MVAGIDLGERPALAHSHDQVARSFARLKTLITATHDLHIVPELASRVIVIGEDRTIIADDTAANILSNHEWPCFPSWL